MGRFKDTEGIARRVMTLFFMVDTSGTMEGAKIGTVNTAIEGVIDEIKKISDDSADAQIKVAALEFSTGARLLSPKPVDATDFKWKYLQADGMTHLGEACKLLNEKLSPETGFMQATSGSFAPVVILMSDGQPNDDYKKGLEILKKNPWFEHGLKTAIAIGDDADKNVLAEFTGSEEAVMTAHSPEVLAKLIRFVSITSSQIGGAGQKASASNSTKQDVLNAQIQDLAAFEPQDNNIQDKWVS